MATWREMANVDVEAHAALELPACVHRLHRPHVAGFVYRQPCPQCGGDGCAECDQTGEVETLLSPAELRRMLEIPNDA